MFNFQNEPPKDERGQSLPLMRCPTHKPISGIITSTNLVGTQTHYYRGRTIPCDSGNCPACSDGVPWRWHGYVSLFSATSSRQVLFEFTARAAEPLTAYRETYGTLRGCKLTAKRINSSANARVMMQCIPADLAKLTIPKEPDLLAALSIIWNIERPAIAIEGINKNAPALDIAQDPGLQENRIKRILDGTVTPAPNGNGQTE